MCPPTEKNDMTTTIVSARLGAAAALLLLTVASAQESAIDIVPVRALEAAAVRTTGRAVPKWSARVGCRVSGVIASWGKEDGGNFLDVGSHVKEGQELFRLSSETFDAKIAVARAGLLRAKAQLADMKAGTRAERIAAAEAGVAEIRSRLDELDRDEERYRRLVEEDKTVPAKKLEEIRMQRSMVQAQQSAAKARLDEAKAGSTATEIEVAAAHVVEAEAQLAVAELDKKGHDRLRAVLRRRDPTIQKPGDYVNNAPFVEVLELVSDSMLEAELKLPEAYFRDVGEGSTMITISSPMLAQPMEVPITRIVNSIDTKDGTFAFRVTIPAEKRERLVPGAFLEGKVAVARPTVAVAIPVAALERSKDGDFVYLVKGDILKRTAVKVGERLSDAVIIREGLGVGDSVAVGSKDLVRDGASVKDAKSKKSAAGEDKK
jgi:hypothetical protein